jgi:hypothetical protein
MPIWHLTSILAHLATTACVFLLIRRLIHDFQGAALAAALFAIHSIQTETVAWLSASGDLLLTSFLVLSVYCYVGRKGLINKRRSVRLGPSRFTICPQPKECIAVRTLPRPCSEPVSFGAKAPNPAMQAVGGPLHEFLAGRLITVQLGEISIAEDRIEVGVFGR